MDWINGTTQGSENSLMFKGELTFLPISLTGVDNQVVMEIA